MALDPWDRVRVGTRIRRTISQALLFFFVSMGSSFSRIGESQAIVVFMDKQVTFDGPSRQALKIRWYIYTKKFPNSKNK